jgi:hypothetical protein
MGVATRCKVCALQQGVKAVDAQQVRTCTAIQVQDSWMTDDLRRNSSSMGTAAGATSSRSHPSTTSPPLFDLSTLTSPPPAREPRHAAICRSASVRIEQ